MRKINVMKRLLAAALAVAATSAMSITVLAAEAPVTAENGTRNIGVTATYVGGALPADVVSVDVEWGELQFTYTLEGTREWDSATNSYKLSGASDSWTAKGGTVKLTNHSNVDVRADLAYTSEESAVSGAFTYSGGKTADTDGKVKLLAGVEGQRNNADSVTASLTLSGIPSNATASPAKLGNITVSISK